MEVSLSAWYESNGVKSKPPDPDRKDLPSNNSASENFSASIYIPQTALFGGCTSGNILVWRFNVRGHAKSQGLILSSHQGPVQCLDYFEEVEESARLGGRRTQLLFSGSVDGSIKIWDPFCLDRKDMCIQTLTAHSGTITALCITATHALITCSNDHTIKIWKPDPGRGLLLHPWYNVYQTISTTASWPVAISSVAEGMFIGFSDGSLAQYKWSDTQLKRSGGAYVLEKSYNHLHDFSLVQLCLIQDHNCIATVSFDHYIYFVDLFSGNIISTFENEKHRRFTCCDWDHVNHQLIAGDAEGYLTIWDRYSEKCIHSTRVLKGPIASAVALPREESIMCTSNTTIQWYKVSRDMKFVELKEHSDAIVDVVVLPATGDALADDRCVFSAALDNTIRCWDTMNMKVNYGFSEQLSEISRMAYAPLKTKLITGHDNGSLRIWNVETGTTITPPVKHTNTISALSIATIEKQHEYVITGGYDGLVCVWDLAREHCRVPRFCFSISAYTGVDSEVLAVCYLPQQLHQSSAAIATGSSGGVIKIWDFNSETLLISLEPHPDAISCMLIDGHFLFAGCDNGLIYVWNVHSLEDPYELDTIQAHKKAVRSMIFINELDQLLSCSNDGRIKIWQYGQQAETTEFACLIEEFRHKGSLTCLAYHSALGRIVCGTKETSLLLYKWPE